MVETCVFLPFFCTQLYPMQTPTLARQKRSHTPHYVVITVVSQKSAHPLLLVPCIGVKVHLNECPLWSKLVVAIWQPPIQAPSLKKEPGYEASYLDRTQGVWEAQCKALCTSEENLTLKFTKGGFASHSQLMRLHSLGSLHSWWSFAVQSVACHHNLSFQGWRLKANPRPTLTQGQLKADADSRPTQGRLKANSRPTQGQLKADSRPTQGRLKADSRPTQGRLKANSRLQTIT